MFITSSSDTLDKYSELNNWAAMKDSGDLDCLGISLAKVGPMPIKTLLHYDDVIMTMLASQITSLTVVYSIVYSGVNQRKHQSPASLAFVREIHRGPVNFPHKWPVTRKMFPFDDVIMWIEVSSLLVVTEPSFNLNLLWYWLLLFLLTMLFITDQVFFMLLLLAIRSSA